MTDVLNVSYTGDILAHRRCPRAWAYEKYVGFEPYEQSQAMEGRLVHHAMEWLTKQYDPELNSHASKNELEAQLKKYFRVLWARGIRTKFQSKQETLDRILNHLFPNNNMHLTVKAAIEGAKHTEYELKAVKAILRDDFFGKSRMVLTGVLDLVVQQRNALSYQQQWQWNDRENLIGEVVDSLIMAHENDLEIWDYKATKSDTEHVKDYVIQLLTYAELYKERSGKLPVRCVLYFVNEDNNSQHLLAIPIDEDILKIAQNWTINEAKKLRRTTKKFEENPIQIQGGYLDWHDQYPVGSRMDRLLKQQCTSCNIRFDCEEYIGFLGDRNHPDIDILNVNKN